MATGSMSTPAATFQQSTPHSTPLQTMDTLLSILAAIISSYLTYFFTNRSNRNDAIVKFKEQKYSNLLLKLQGFVGATASGKTKREFFEEQYQSWLYCSDDVVVAVNNLIRLIIDSQGKAPEPEAGRKAIGDIVVAMRKDLLGKTSLDYRSFRYTDVLE
jgi:hypothetical protein